MRLSLLLLLTGVVTLSQSDPTRELVILLFRHGDRSPANPYANYPNASAWPQGYGQLTVEGMQQQYGLGEFIKETYVTSGYLPSPYNRTNVYIRSSDVDRTIMSAQAQLSAIFPPEGAQVWNSSILWQPIPVHTVSADNDDILQSYDKKCPAYTDVNTQFISSQEYIDMSNKYQDLFKTISQATGDTVNLGNIWQFADTIFCDRQHNIRLPKWANKNLLTLKALNDWDLKIRFGRKEVQKFVAGRLLWYFWQLIDARMNNSVGIKAYFLSGHDVTIIALLSAFNIWNELQPPYASLVMAELFKDDNNLWSVQFSFKNSTNGAFVLPVAACNNTMCSVSQLKEFTKDVTLTEEDWRIACKLDNSFDLTILPYVIVIPILGMIIIFLCCVWVLIIPCKRLGKPKYQRLQTH